MARIGQILMKVEKHLYDYLPCLLYFVLCQINKVLQKGIAEDLMSLKQYFDL